MSDLASNDSNELSNAPESKPGKRRNGIYTPAGCKPLSKYARNRGLYYRVESGPVIQAYVPTPTGKRRRSTGCREEGAAIAWLNVQERRAADPSLAAAGVTTLLTAIEDYCAMLRGQESKARKGHKVKASTVQKILDDKFGQLVKFAEEERGYPEGSLPLSAINGDFIWSFIKWRQEPKKYLACRKSGDTLSNYTIRRELNYIRNMLDHARERGKFHLPTSEVIPSSKRFTGSCRRVQRVPNREEAEMILAGLPMRRRVHILWMMVTGERKAEASRARRCHVDLNKMILHVDGGEAAKARGESDGKSDESTTDIVITEVMEPSIRKILDEAPGKGENDLLFLPWVNPSHQIKRVCARLRKKGIQIQDFGVHDFRRFFAHLHLDAGASLEFCSKQLRHTTTALTELVYGNVKKAERLRALYGHQVRALPEMDRLTVSALCKTTQNSQADQTHQTKNEDEKAAKTAGQPEGAGMHAAVHGRKSPGAQVVDLTGTSPVGSNPSVPDLCTAVFAQAQLIAALATLANATADQAAKDVLVQAVRLLAGGSPQPETN